MNIRPLTLFHFLFWNLFATLLGFAQSTDLSVRFIGAPPTQVGIGEAFAIQAEAFHVDANSSPVVNEAITITLELIDPFGIVIFSHVQSPSPFPNPAPAGSAQLDNDSTGTNQVIMQMPWTEASKWSAGNNGIPQLIGDQDFDDPTWTVTVRVSSPSLESITTNNSVSHSFTLIVPDLEVPANSITLQAKDPLTGELITLNPNNGDVLPGMQIQVSGTINNIGAVMTQPGVRFPVDARLFEGTVTANGPGSINLSLDRESVILPASDGVNPTSVLSGASLPYVIPNITLPSEIDVTTFSIQVNVNPADLTTGPVVEEMDGIVNNHQIITFQVGQGTPNLQVNANSFTGDIGTFRGLDPIRIAFSIRNVGNGPVGGTDAFTAQVVLSENDSFDNTDFILREFDLGANALGADLKTNETVNLDWIQQLPDNFEGDYYLLVNINDVVFPLDNTPVITLISENSGTTELLADENRPSERPHTSSDGILVVYERTDINGIQQVFLRNMETGDTIQLTTSFSNPNIGGNGDSLRPRISADGSTVVFHSMASDLIAGDENEHADVFLYKTFSQQLIRAQNFETGEETNNNSYYPELNLDGSMVVFESDATNLQPTGVVNLGRQIFLWNLSSGGGSGSIQAITSGNGESRGASIDRSGNLIVFSSHASNLLESAGSDTNGHEDVFLFKLDDNKSFSYLCSRSSLGQPAVGGQSSDPQISGDGSTIVYQSSATNLVNGKGISLIKVASGGAGYFGSPTAIITDQNGPGTGAVISLENALDVYGQIREEAVKIISNGNGYINPLVTILPDPTHPAPTQVAQVSALLSHPLGEVYSIKVVDVLPNPTLPVYSQRVSETKFGIGGNMESREPSVNFDGQFIAYATKSSNLQDENVTRNDGRVFFNRPGRIASANAILVGGIGEIEVLAHGIGYQNGFLEIEDLSGSGSGAVASYQVDSFGRIASIEMVNSGVDYRLETTTVSVANPRGGSGFIAGGLKFQEVFGIGAARNGGGRVHRVEMTDNGSGYQDLNSTVQGLEGIIAIDGDGIDLDLNGLPDSKLDSSKIKLDYLGGIYLDQTFDIEVLAVPQQGTSLVLSDANQSITILFSPNADPTNSFNIATTSGGGTKSTSVIRDDIVDMIELHWPDRTSLYMGPLIDGNATGGSKFTFSALSGRASTTNQAAISISPRTNMIFSGAGFTRATPSIAPPSVIYGFSEVLSGTTTVVSAGGRRLFDVQRDSSSDDVYLFDSNASRNERVSRSTFGFPVNYLPSSIVSMPSNRFPSISSDGRYVFFSSDAEGRGGLAFGNSNQSPIDNNLVRDVLRHDRKTQAISQTPNVTAIMLNPSSTDNSLNKYSLGNQIEISVSATATLGTIEQVELFLDGKPLNLPISFPPADPILGQYSRDGIYGFNWTPTRPGVYELSVRARDNFGRYSKLNQMSKSIVTVGADSLGEKPIVIMTEPVPGGFGDTFPDYSYGSQLFINVEAYDPDGDLEYVQIYLNGQLLGNAEGRYGNTYIYKWTIQRQDADQQSFVIQAIAKDNDGNIVRSGSLSGITVENNLSQRPTVRLDRVTVDQEGVKLRAIAGQQGNFFSGVSRVQFFANGVTIDAVGSPTSFLSTGEEAYDLTWKPEKAGVYTLYAMAVGSVGDNGDHYTISTPLVFEVTEFHLSSFNSDNVAPMITLVSPGPHSSGIAFATAEMGSLVDETATNYRSVVNLSVSSPGYGYSEPPQVIFYGGGGTGASATASIMNGAVTKVNLINKGSGYPNTLKLQPSTVVSGVGLDMTPVVKDGVLTSIPIASGGSGYSSTDLVSIFDLQNQAYAGFGARAVPIVDANGSILSLKILDAGQNYDPAYMQVSILGNGSGFEANASNATIENGVVSEVLISSTGSGYTNGFSIIPVPGTDGTGSGFNAEVKTEDIMDGTVSLNLISGGSGYSTKPDVILDGGKFLNYDYPLTFVENSRVILQAEVFDPDGTVEEVRFYGSGKLLGSAPLGNLTGVTVVNAGSGFAIPPSVTFTGGGGSGADATAIINQNGALVAIQLTNIGSGYTSPPIVNISPSNGASASATIDTDVINNATRIAGTNRYFIEWVPQDPGTYNISVEGIDNDFSSTILSSDRYITIVPESSSKTPTISLLGPTNGEYYTSGSKLRIYAQADDPDGTLEWVRFYVNGEPYERPLTAHSGIGSVNFPYGVEWTVPAPGTYTFSASAMDNSGNGIMSGISTITSTTGKGILPEAAFKSPVRVANATANVIGGSLNSIPITSGGFGYVTVPKVEILGDGQGASAVAIIQTDQSLPNYSQVVDINITNPGTGYTGSSTQIQILGGFPQIKPSGETAIARLNFDIFGNPFITVVQEGSGYTSVPRVEIQGAGTGMTAVARLSRTGSVSSVQITNAGTGYFTNGNNISFVGGFVFSEMSMEVEAFDLDDEVSEVTFYENGVPKQMDNTPPYEFNWQIGSSGYYDLHVGVMDSKGNRNVSSILRREVFNELKNNVLLLNKPNLENQVFNVGGTINIISKVQDPLNEIESLNLFVNGKMEVNASNLVNDLYQSTWMPQLEGTYELQLFALDSSNNYVGISEIAQVRVAKTFDWSGGLPRVNIMNPVMDEFFTTKSSIQITANASDPDFDLKEVQFYLNGSPIGDPLATPVSGYSDFFPYMIRWEPETVGIHFVYAVATDYFGNSQMSQAVAVRVTEGTALPPKPKYAGIVQVAEVQPKLVGDGLSFTISNPGFGYITPPKVVIDNFGTGGTGASFIIKQSEIDSLTGEIKSNDQNVSGAGYTSLPSVRLEGGFPFIEASGVPGLAEATGTTIVTSPDDAGNRREVPGLASIGVVSRGSGYLQPPTVMISHPTAEGAEAVVTLRPATNGRGSEIDQITVTLPGGGRPIRFDANGSNPIEWLPGYDVPRTSVSLIGGIPFDEATFEFAEPVFTDPQSVLSSIKFYAVGNNQHLELPELNDNPFRWTFGTAQPGVYALYAEVVDSRGNVRASEPIYREVRPASLPEGDFTSPYRARGEAIIVNGQITGIELTSPGASYNLPPKVVFEGDGTGATASVTIDTTTGHITAISMDNSGSGYTNAKVRFEEGWVTPQQIDEYVLGETITMGLTAFAKSAEIREIRLIVNNAERDETTYPTLTAEPDYGGYEFPSQEYGTLTGQGELDANIQRLDRWKYDGTMPDYNIYFTPSDLGIYNIEAMLIDHTGYSTVTSSYRVRVHNGEPPVVELVTPRTGESFALDYDRNQDIRLVAKAQDPDWQARFGGDQQLDRRNELNRVWFYADDQFVGVGNRILGTDLYQFVWRPTVAGTYRITAIAVDDQVGDVNQEFGDIGRVGGIGTSDPQYVTITNRSGSRPPDILLLNPSIPQIYPGFTEIGALQSQPPPNDDRNLQPDLDPQNLANEFRLAAEYPNLYTSGSRDMVWAWADDRDGDLQSVQFYVNGANGVIQLRKNPANGDSIYLNDGTVARDIVFGTDLNVGSDTIETTKNLKNFLNGLVSTGYKINPFLLPGAATVYEKSTLLIDFENSFDSNLTSSDETKIFPWLFKELPNTLGEYQVRQSHPVAQVLNGFGGTYFAHPFVPGLNGIFSMYAVAKDTSNNRVMSIPSHYKSTMGDFNSSSTSATIQMLANGTTVPFGNNSHTIISNVTSQYPLEYVEFFDNGRIFDTPESVVDENGTYHRGRAIEFDSPPYLATWNVSEVGEHIIYARFTDIKGNSFLSNQIRVLVEPPEGKHPQGTLTIYIGADDGDGELVAGVSVGSTVIARAEFVDADSSGQTVDTAHFYLNGNLISTQTSPPFFAKISPTTMKRLSVPEGTWELAVVGKDEDGNEVELKQTALVRGAVSLPTAKMISYSGSTGEIYDGTNLRLSVVATGDAESLAVMRGMAFFANGIFLGTDLGIDEVDGSGNVMQKTYEFEFEVNYLLHAKSDGSLSITGLTVVDRAGALQPNITAVVATNSLSYKVTTPKPWENVESLTGEINRGLLDGSLSPTELIQITKTRTGDNYYAWISEVLDRSAFQQRVDLMAAHKVALGEWFQSYQDFADDINFYLKSTTGLLPSATSSALLKTYIDDLLQGTDYRSKFGQLPFLVGSWFSREIYNYPINRKDFVAQCLFNKYGQNSSVSQNLQGSRKLLSFWGISEPTYWEINGIRPTSPTVQPPEPDPPPRRDAGYSILNNFNPGRYFSGELAVELIWRLATETKTNGLPYILYTNDIRNSVFSTATLMSLMWQDKWDFSEKDIQELLPYTETDKIKKVLTDPRFNARFNFLWRSSKVYDEIRYPNWKYEKWFGSFNDAKFPWIYHPVVGWLYCSGNDPNNIWFYSDDYKDWFWTSKSLNLDERYLWFIKKKEMTWIAFMKEKTVPPKGQDPANPLSSVTPFPTISVLLPYIYNKDKKVWEPYIKGT